MHLFYTPSENTQRILKLVHADREKGMKWKDIVVKYNRSRTWLAGTYRWYTQVFLKGGKQS